MSVFKIHKQTSCNPCGAWYLVKGGLCKQKIRKMKFRYFMGFYFIVTGNNNPPVTSYCTLVTGGLYFRRSDSNVVEPQEVGFLRLFFYCKSADTNAIITGTKTANSGMIISFHSSFRSCFFCVRIFSLRDNNVVHPRFFRRWCANLQQYSYKIAKCFTKRLIYKNSLSNKFSKAQRVYNAL